MCRCKRLRRRGFVQLRLNWAEWSAGGNPLLGIMAGSGAPESAERDRWCDAISYLRSDIFLCCRGRVRCRDAFFWDMECHLRTVPSGATSGNLNSVACPSSSECEAVGYYVPLNLGPGPVGRVTFWRHVVRINLPTTNFQEPAQFDFVWIARDLCCRGLVQQSGNASEFQYLANVGWGLERRKRDVLRKAKARDGPESRIVGSVLPVSGDLRCHRRPQQ